jgi:DNA ligase (NAD+)
MTLEKISELEARLKECREAYYNGDPIVTDDVYDALEDELRTLAPQHPLLKKVGASPDGKTKWQKVPHLMPMSSLNKVNDTDELFNWSESVNETLVRPGTLSWSEKLDGISISLNYEEGKLKSALTRGDGLVGEDILANVVMMRGVKRTLPQPFTGSIRGEIVLTHDKWERHFPDYANPRNAASGIAKRESRDKAQGCCHLTVMAYDVASREKTLESEREKFLFLKEEMGLKVPNHGFDVDAFDMQTLYEQYEGDLRDELNYDIDGIVIRFQSQQDFQRAGERNGRPFGAVALKFANQGAVTTLDDVVWQVGNTGRITPVAIFEPVQLAGAEVTRANLHNEHFLTSLGVYPGDTILVERANDVIPQVVKVVEKYKEIALKGPNSCPVCDAPVEREGKYMTCSDSLGCPAQTAGRIKRWIESLGILDWGDFVVEALVEEGLVNTISDLYDLEPESIAELTNANDAVVGMKTATKLLKELRAKSKDTTFDAVIGGLSIPHCRKSTARKMMKAGYDSVSALGQASKEELEAVDGLGNVKAASIHEGLQEIMEVLQTLILHRHVEIQEAEGPLVDKTFCITGSLSKPRKNIERYIEDAGGTMKGVSKSLSYLVINDPDSTSSKARKARKYGIPMLSEDDLYDMIEGKG